MRYSMIAALMVLSLPLSPLGAQVDSARVAELVESAFDTARGPREQARSELRRQGVLYAPELEHWVLRSQFRTQIRMGAALVLTGEPGRPLVLRLLLVDSTKFTMHHAVDVLETSRELLDYIGPWLNDRDARTRAAAVELLDVYRDDAEVLTDAIAAALADTSAIVQSAALGLHLSMVDSRTAQSRFATQLISQLEPARTDLRAVIYQLGNIHPYGRQAIPRILQIMPTHPDEEVRWLSARVLTWQAAEPAEAQPVLLRMLSDRSDTVRVEVLLAIGAIGVKGLSADQAQAVVDSVDARLRSRHRWTREAAATAIAQLGAATIGVMIRELRSRDRTVAMTAAQGLSAMPERPEIDRPLLDALSDSRDSVRLAVALALVGPGRRVLDELRRFATERPEGRATAARLAIGLIEAPLRFDVADRCYRIEYGPWNPPIQSRTVEGLLPPRAVRFRSMIGRWPYGDRPAGYIVEQPYDSAWVRTGEWYPDTVAQRIRMNAAPSLSGFVFNLRVDANNVLVGEANTYWDFKREREVSSVVLRPFDCSTSP